MTGRSKNFICTWILFSNLLIGEICKKRTLFLHSIKINFPTAILVVRSAFFDRLKVVSVSVGFRGDNLHWKPLFTWAIHPLGTRMKPRMSSQRSIQRPNPYLGLSASPSSPTSQERCRHLDSAHPSYGERPRNWTWVSQDGFKKLRL